jgi:transposase InsO family protein
LAARDETCSRRRVGRLMDEMGLVAIQPRTFKPRTTDSRHTLGYSDNLLLNAPPPDAINQIWVGDITYVPLVGGDFLFLALFMDLFSRRDHRDAAVPAVGICKATCKRRSWQRRCAWPWPSGACDRV